MHTYTHTHTAQEPDVTVAAADGRDGGYHDVVRGIDASITRMASLLLKLVCVRIGLGVEHMRDSVPSYQLMLGGQQQVGWCLHVGKRVFVCMCAGTCACTCACVYVCVCV